MQTVAMLDTTTREVVNNTLMHEGSNVREFYSTLPLPVRVGIEATGSMQWFVNLMEELGIECQVGHPAKIRAAEPRKQKHDRRDADLMGGLSKQGNPLLRGVLGSCVAALDRFCVTSESPTTRSVPDRIPLQSQGRYPSPGALLPN
jgi:hypothetical protein